MMKKKAVESEKRPFVGKIDLSQFNKKVRVAQEVSPAQIKKKGRNQGMKFKMRSANLINAIAEDEADISYIEEDIAARDGRVKKVYRSTPLQAHPKQRILTPPRNNPSVPNAIEACLSSFKKGVQ